LYKDPKDIQDTIEQLRSLGIVEWKTGKFIVLSRLITFRTVK
jgi:hypothetical protein